MAWKLERHSTHRFCLIGHQSVRNNKASEYTIYATLYSVFHLPNRKVLLQIYLAIPQAGWQILKLPIARQATVSSNNRRTGMVRTGGTVPAVHTSPRKFGTCNGLEVHLLCPRTGQGTPVQWTSKRSSPGAHICRPPPTTLCFPFYGRHQIISLFCTSTARAVSFMNPDKFVCRASTLLMYMLDYLGEELYWELLVYRIWGLDWTGRSSRNEDWWTGWFLRTFPISGHVHYYLGANNNRWPQPPTV